MIWEIKNELTLISLSILVVLAISFVFSYSGGLTGFAVLDEQTPSEELIDYGNVTREDALVVINESEKLVQDMKDRGFSGEFVGDAMIETRRVFEQAEFAEILRNNSIPNNDFKKIQARKELKLVNWAKLDYSSVMIAAKDVKKRYDDALRLTDLIEIQADQVKGALEDPSLSTASLFPRLADLNATSVLEILDEMRTAINDGRYEEAEQLLDEAKLEYETQKLELTTLASLKRSSRNVFQRYWYLIIIFLGVMGFGGFYVYNKMQLKKLKKDIRKMKFEKESLIDLMKKNQINRFQEDNISELVYNIRAKKYQERINKISQSLPVLESRLGKVIKKDKKVLKKPAEVNKNEKRR